MRLFIKIFSIFLCLTLFSCKKKIEDDYRPEFIGFWYCPPNADNEWSTIDIDNDGNAIYEGNTYKLTPATTIKGKARVNDNKLKIGRFNGFKILVYPYRIEDTINAPMIPSPTWSTQKKARWTMKIQGGIMHGGGGIYYRADN